MPLIAPKLDGINRLYYLFGEVGDARVDGEHSALGSRHLSARLPVHSPQRLLEKGGWVSFDLFCLFVLCCLQPIETSPDLAADRAECDRVYQKV
jgi:hypothetical protein